MCKEMNPKKKRLLGNQNWGIVPYSASSSLDLPSVPSGYFGLEEMHASAKPEGTCWKVSQNMGIVNSGDQSTLVADVLHSIETGRKISHPGTVKHKMSAVY